MRTLAFSIALVSAFAVVPAASATSPPSVCAVAWNHRAPAKLRASIAARHARSAFIDARVLVGIDTFTKGGGSSSTSSSGCAIQFILRNGFIVEVWGPYERGVISHWSGGTASKRPFPMPSNARVHADGTVGFHG